MFDVAALLEILCVSSYMYMWSGTLGRRWYLKFTLQEGKLRKPGRQKYLNTAKLFIQTPVHSPLGFCLVGFCLVLISFTNDDFNRHTEKFTSLLQIKEDQGLKK